MVSGARINNPPRAGGDDLPATSAQISVAIAAILLARFISSPIQEICTIGGFTLEDFIESVASKEIFGLGEQKGRERGFQ